MQKKGLLAAVFTLVLAAPALAGCLSPEVTGDIGSVADQTLSVNGNAWRASTLAGATSTLAAPSVAGATVSFEDGVLVWQDDGRLVPVDGPVDVAAGATLRYLPPAGADSVAVTIDGVALDLAVNEDAEQLVSGLYALQELDIQRDRFPFRTPGHENYIASQAYFKEVFEGFGYDVVVDPYDMNALNDVKSPTGSQAGPSSFANVVAYKAGTADPPRYLIFGGHYDVVEQTRDGALDNTAGSMATLAMARAFKDITTEHTMVFALWGGEEDGLLGSQFWVQTNPEKLPMTSAYFNLDVTGMAWPGPITKPDPILITGAPDGPIADSVLAEARTVNDAFARYAAQGAEFLYQPMLVGGQVGGAGINSQSDHRSFSTRGVPSLMISTGNLDPVFALIHSPRDTVYNLSAYLVTGVAPFDGVLTAEEEAEGRALLAESIAVQTWVPFYMALRADSGHWVPQG